MELALLTARRAYDAQMEVAVSLITPEDAALAIFGERASQAVGRLLGQAGVELVTGAHASVPERGTIVLRPGLRTLRAERVLALPQLFGPSVPGVPADAPGGFIPIAVQPRWEPVEKVTARYLTPFLGRPRRRRAGQPAGAER